MTLSVKPFGCMPSSLGLRRRPVADHRALSAGHLPADRDQRRRRRQRLQPRADAAVQGQAARAEGSRQGARRRRHDDGRGPRVPGQAPGDEPRVPPRSAQGGLHAPPTSSTRSGAKKNRLAYLKNRVINAVTGATTRSTRRPTIKLLDDRAQGRREDEQEEVGRQRGARGRSRGSGGARRFPAGRKSLRVVN